MLKETTAEMSSVEINRNVVFVAPLRNYAIPPSAFDSVALETRKQDY
jgi:hypothetical protein